MESSEDIIETSNILVSGHFENPLKIKRTIAESAGAVSQKLVGNESFHILTLPQSNRDFQRDANVNECSIAMRTHY